ncbi:uncharacterized protein LOC122010136 isoform X2 [Zingiber officinale]|uniref:uncharacterized protein LOC122010136 isoform X2 n=2 Tax=Zingiber officinale TaxID=94328 RepID=UPI001C4AF50F|nr:uncharacterized protein LOC122010136 isoform X2 [Zingiber officinale]
MVALTSISSSKISTLSAALALGTRKALQDCYGHSSITGYHHDYTNDVISIRTGSIIRSNLKFSLSTASSFLDSPFSSIVVFVRISGSRSFSFILLASF